jgi:hypothetical protein
MRGGYLAASPGEQAGDTTAWSTAFRRSRLARSPWPFSQSRIVPRSALPRQFTHRPVVRGSRFRPLFSSTSRVAAGTSDGAGNCRSSRPSAPEGSSPRGWIGIGQSFRHKTLSAIRTRFRSCGRPRAQAKSHGERHACYEDTLRPLVHESTSPSYALTFLCSKQRRAAVCPLVAAPHNQPASPPGTRLTIASTPLTRPECVCISARAGSRSSAIARRHDLLASFLVIASRDRYVSH